MQRDAATWSAALGLDDASARRGPADATRGEFALPQPAVCRATIAAAPAAMIDDFRIPRSQAGASNAAVSRL
jgi:hypothetical protein